MNESTWIGDWDRAKEKKEEDCKLKITSPSYHFFSCKKNVNVQWRRSIMSHFFTRILFQQRFLCLCTEMVIYASTLFELQLIIPSFSKCHLIHRLMSNLRNFLHYRRMNNCERFLLNQSLRMKHLSSWYEVKRWDIYSKWTWVANVCNILNVARSHSPSMRMWFMTLKPCVTAQKRYTRVSAEWNRLLP